MAEESARLRIEVDASEAHKSTGVLDKLTQSAQNTERATKSLEESVKRAEASFNRASVQITAFGTGIAKVTDTTKKLDDGFKRVISSLASVSGGIDQFGEAINRATNSTATMADTLARAESVLARLATKTGEMSDVTRRSSDEMMGMNRSTGMSISSFLKLTGAVTGVYLGFHTLRKGIKFIIDESNKLEVSIQRFAAVTGASTYEMERFALAAREIGTGTVYGVNQAAEAMIDFNRLGFDLKETMQALPSAMHLADASFSSLHESIELIGRTLVSFNIDASETARVADVLAVATAETGISMESLGHVLLRSAPIATRLGVDLEELTAIIGVLNTVNIRGERAASQLRRAFHNMSAQTVKNVEILSDYGLTFADLTQEGQSFTDVLRELGERGLTASDAMKLFGADSSQIILHMIDLDEKILEVTETMREVDGTAEEMSKTVRDTLPDAFKRFGSAFKEMAVNFAESTAVLEPAKKALNTMAGWMEHVAAQARTNPLTNYTMGFVEFNRTVAGTFDPADPEDFYNRVMAKHDEFLQKISEEPDAKGVISAAEKAEEVAEQLLHRHAQNQQKFRLKKNMLGVSPEELAAFKKSQEELLRQREYALQAAEMLRSESVFKEVQDVEDAAERELQARIKAEKEATAEAEREANERERIRNEKLKPIYDSLKTEEEMIEDSYTQRLEIVKENTLAESEEYHKLSKQLEAQRDAELQALRDREAERQRIIDEREEREIERIERQEQRELQARLREKERLEDSLATDEERIERSYKRRWQAILENEEIGENERRELLSRLEEQRIEEMKRLRQRELRDRLQAMETFEDDLFTLAQSGSRTMARMYKAAAIANTIIKTHESAVGAYNALIGIPIVGPVLAPAAAAAAVAAGMARVQAIRSQPVGNYERGGIIGGHSYTGDRLTANVNSREMILNLQQQKRLFDIAEGRTRASDQPIKVVVELGDFPSLVRPFEDHSSNIRSLMSMGWGEDDSPRFSESFFERDKKPVLPRLVSPNNYSGVSGTDRRKDSEEKVRVVVNNYSGGEVEVEQQEVDGETLIELTVRGAEERIARNISAGRGAVPRAIEGTYGMRRGRG